MEARVQLKLAVNGAAGRMGKMLVKVIAEEDECRLVSATEAAGHPRLGEDSGRAAGTSPNGVPLTEDVRGEPEVLLDFSTPEACLHRARECARNGTALVIGTTGLGKDQIAELKESVASSVPVLVAPNMSIGVNLLFSLVEQAARAVGRDWDIEIVEAHHNRKKDAPSGTAGELASIICNALGWDLDRAVCHGREGAVGERPHRQVGVHAVRGGDIVGKHTVLLAGKGQTIELTHTASSRDVFARGAVRAAGFLVDQPAGFYTMDDVLR